MKRILVADDSVTIQKVIALTFADEPYEVKSVGTGAEALELVKSWNPDIVLADVIMPQMNGYELCRAVKQHGETSAVPVLLLAGTFEAFDEEEAKSVGANDFITKPFESGELIEKVRALVGDAPEPAPVQARDVPEAPVIPDAQMPSQPESSPQPAPPSAGTAEPDIWDILSDTESDTPSPAAEGGVPGAAFTAVEDTGVIDVGTFDVGLGRPESPSPATQPPPAVSTEDEAVFGPDDAQPAPQVQQTPEVPPSMEPSMEMEERSRVENMEKDFFGFETGAVEEVAEGDFLEDAIEEVTFEMEQPAASTEVTAQEVSFDLPGPEGNQAVPAGETLSPDAIVSERLSPSDEAPQLIPEPSPEPSAGSAPDQPDEVVEDTVPSVAPELSADFTAQPTPEPAFELSVDLASELPEEFRPEPAAPVITTPAETPVEPSPVLSADDGEDRTGAPTGVDAAGGALDDAAIRKMIEEKVEKIAWEVIPELAEVVIREAIQKIKDGS